MKKEDLIIGKRYYIDSVKDCTGIFIGLDNMGRIQYNELEGNFRGYIVNDGIVLFSTCFTTTLV